MDATQEKTPLYRQVYDQLKRAIDAGHYTRGSALPSEIQLSKDFGVSQITIRRGLQELVLDGIIERRQGVGNLVRDTPRILAIGLSNFTSDVASGRLRLVRTLLVDELSPAPLEVSRKLGVQHGSKLRHLVRLDSECGFPLSIDEAYIPPRLAAKISPEIASSPLFLHQWQLASGIQMVRTDYDVYVQMPQPKDQEWLEIGSDTPILVTIEVVRDTSDRACVWIESRYRGDRGHLSGNVILVQKEIGKGKVGE